MEKTGYLAQWPLLIPSIIVEWVRLENAGMVATTEGATTLIQQPSPSVVWTTQCNFWGLRFLSENLGNPKVELYSTEGFHLESSHIY